MRLAEEEDTYTYTHTHTQKERVCVCACVRERLGWGIIMAKAVAGLGCRTGDFEQNGGLERLIG